MTSSRIPIETSGIHNMSLHVADPDVSARFYCELLGAEIVSDTGWTDDADRLAVVGLPTGGTLRTVTVASAGSDTSLSLVGFRKLDESRIAGRFQDVGVVHFAFTVEDVAASAAALAAAGVRQLAPPRSVVLSDGSARLPLAFFTDPNGYVVELLQRTPVPLSSKA